MSKVRGLIAVGSMIGGAVALFPMPLADLALMAVVQLLIVVGVTLSLKKPLHVRNQGLFVLGYAVVGAMLGLALEICIPFLGKLLLAPFAALWCYLLGEITLFSAKRR
jgi:uncharacterized protein (DUF697 family)